MPSKPAEQLFGFPLAQIFSLCTLLDANLRFVGDARVVDRFEDRLVGVAMFGVLPTTAMLISCCGFRQCAAGRANCRG